MSTLRFLYHATMCKFWMWLAYRYERKCLHACARHQQHAEWFKVDIARMDSLEAKAEGR